MSTAISIAGPLAGAPVAATTFRSRKKRSASALAKDNEPLAKRAATTRREPAVASATTKLSAEDVITQMTDLTATVAVDPNLENIEKRRMINEYVTAIRNAVCEVRQEERVRLEGQVQEMIADQNAAACKAAEDEITAIRADLERTRTEYITKAAENERENERKIAAITANLERKSTELIKKITKDAAALKASLDLAEKEKGNLRDKLAEIMSTTVDEDVLQELDRVARENDELRSKVASLVAKLAATATTVTARDAMTSARPMARSDGDSATDGHESDATAAGTTPQATTRSMQVAVDEIEEKSAADKDDEEWNGLMATLRPANESGVSFPSLLQEFASIGHISNRFSTDVAAMKPITGSVKEHVAHAAALRDNDVGAAFQVVTTRLAYLHLFTASMKDLIKTKPFKNVAALRKKNLAIIADAAAAVDPITKVSRPQNERGNTWKTMKPQAERIKALVDAAGYGIIPIIAENFAAINSAIKDGRKKETCPFATMYVDRLVKKATIEKISRLVGAERSGRPGHLTRYDNVLRNYVTHLACALYEDKTMEIHQKLSVKNLEIFAAMRRGASDEELDRLQREEDDLIEAQGRLDAESEYEDED